MVISCCWIANLSGLYKDTQMNWFISTITQFGGCALIWTPFGPVYAPASWVSVFSHWQYCLELLFVTKVLQPFSVAAVSTCWGIRSAQQNKDSSMVLWWSYIQPVYCHWTSSQTVGQWATPVVFSSIIEQHNYNIQTTEVKQVLKAVKSFHCIYHLCLSCLIISSFMLFFLPIPHLWWIPLLFPSLLWSMHNVIHVKLHTVGYLQDSMLPSLYKYLCKHTQPL